MCLTPSSLALVASCFLAHSPQFNQQNWATPMRVQYYIDILRNLILFALSYPLLETKTNFYCYQFHQQQYSCLHSHMAEFSSSNALALKAEPAVEYPSNLLHLKPIPQINDSGLSLDNQQLTISHLLQQSNVDASKNHPSYTQGNIQNNTLNLSLDQSKLLTQENQSMIVSKIRVNMEEQINKYFENCAAKINHFEVNKDKFVLEATRRVKKQIRKGEINVNQEIKQIIISKEILKKRRIQQINAQKKAIEQAKDDIYQKLKEIEQSQASLCHSTIKQGKSRSVQIKKIQFNPEQRHRISQLLKKKNEFQKSLEEKTQQFYQHTLRLKRQKQQGIQKYFEQQNAKKKDIILKRLKQLQKKSTERQQVLKHSVLRINHQYIHKEIQKKFSKLQKLKQQKNKDRVRQMTQRHKINIKEIDQHDKKYTQLLENRSKSMTKLEIVHHKTHKRQQTFFRKIIDEEMFEIKQKNYQKLMKLKEHQYKDKIYRFQQKIDKQHKPKIDPSKSNILVLPKSYSSVSLSKEQRFEKGLEYLSIAKELKKDPQDIKPAVVEEKLYGYKAYKDYLKEGSPKNINATKKQLNQIMSSNEKSNFNSIIRAKHLSEGLQAKLKRGQDYKLYYSAKTKLSLLEQLY